MMSLMFSVTLSCSYKILPEVLKESNVAYVLLMPKVQCVRRLVSNV